MQDWQQRLNKARVAFDSVSIDLDVVHETAGALMAAAHTGPVDDGLPHINLERVPDDVASRRLQQAFDTFPLIVDLAAANPALLAPIAAGYAPGDVIRWVTPAYKTMVATNAERPAAPLRHVKAAQTTVASTQAQSLLAGCALIEPTTAITSDAQLVQVARLGRIARAIENEAFHVLVPAGLIDGLSTQTQACNTDRTTRLLSRADLYAMRHALCRVDEIVTLLMAEGLYPNAACAVISRRLGLAGVDTLMGAAHAFAANDDTAIRAAVVDAAEVDVQEVNPIADRLRLAPVAS